MQCALLVDCGSLSVMGAPLANGGINPVTGQKVLDGSTVEKVTSVMSPCGMYDFSGNWAFEVGIPAKSGVGGGIIGVLPGQLSIAVFSPLLDENFNSVRGIHTFRRGGEAYDEMGKPDHHHRQARCGSLRLITEGQSGRAANCADSGRYYAAFKATGDVFTGPLAVLFF